MPTLLPILSSFADSGSSLLEVPGVARSARRSSQSLTDRPRASRSIARSAAAGSWNQELYQRLRLSLGLGLRRQVFLVVCDDLPLRDRLAGRLAQELPAPQLTTLRLEPHQPTLSGAIESLSETTVQLLGVEQLTRQAARLQRQFLAELEALASNWAHGNLSLLLWVPRPWLYTIRESAPQFWACCTGTFEFEGQPAVLLNPLSGADRAGSWIGGRDRGRPTLTVLPRPNEGAKPIVPPCPPAPTVWERWVMEATAARAKAAAKGVTAEVARASLETAAQCYQRAINWVQTHGEPAALRSLYYDLGGVYGDWVRWGDPAEAWERAVLAYRAAIGDGSGGDRAWRVAARNNLGTALWSWARYGDSVTRLQGAIDSYRAALAEYAEQPGTEPAAGRSHPGDDRLQPDLLYGTVQANLGTAYLNLAQVDVQEQWLLLAASAFEAALPYRNPADRPAAYAATQNNLGTTYWQLGRQLQPLDPQRRRDCWQRAAQAYAQALAIDPAIPLGFDRAAAASQLAWIYLQLGIDSYLPLTGSDRAVQLDRALATYVQILTAHGDQPPLRDRALSGAIATIRAIYQHLGLEGQSRALSSIPGQWLPAVIDRLTH